jgi:magnesium transporter
MSDSSSRLDRRLRPILDLLHKHELVDGLVRQQEAPRKQLVEDLVHRQHLAQIGNALGKLHAADIAHLLERLRPDDRRLIWSQVSDEHGGDVLWDVNDSVAETLIGQTRPDRLVAMCRHMDPDDLAYVADLLPEDVREEVHAGIDPEDRRWVAVAKHYPEDTVGHLMTPELLAVPESVTVRETLKTIRRLGEVPEQMDRVFVTDARGRLTGSFALTDLFLHPLRTPVARFMDREPVSFYADSPAARAALAFERYDLVSAPVLDSKDKLIGRLTVDHVMDFVREEAEEDALLREGLRGDEDLFAPVVSSARRRWLWLGLNLFTAFLASRVIGVFQGTIEQLVALATLMPIVASIGGNTGNQTVALFIRGLALHHIKNDNIGYLVGKEVGIAALNGLLWGSVMGLVTGLLYRDETLGIVMAAATLLNLMVAALAGVAVPLFMDRAGRDPALGSSVILTFVTDSMGFFIFLGLAAILLV